MAKQTFTTGQVLTAAQMTSLQQTAMGGGAATAKTASYVLVAADAGTTVAMNAAGATTITVNTGLFAAGDTVFIQNLGAGACTITAGTATVNTSATLALAQYEGGQLYFTSTSASIFVKGAGAAVGGGGKVLQVVDATTSTSTTIASTSYTDTTITATITPTLNTSKILILVTGLFQMYRGSVASPQQSCKVQIVKNGTSLKDFGFINTFTVQNVTFELNSKQTYSQTYLDSPASTSALTYKIQSAAESTANSGAVYWQAGTNNTSTIQLLEIGA